MSSESRQVSLLVLNWNGAGVLPRCLESLEAAAAGSRHRVNLVVVDNASADGSESIPLERDAHWELIAAGSNLGFAGGMNLGLRKLLATEQDYICILNNDIEADPDFIDPLIDDLEVTARRGAACPRIHYQNPADRIWYGGGAVGRWTRISRHLGIRRQARGRWLQAADTGYLTGCCIMGRAAFWKLTDGFDEDFEFYSEDVDLSLRARVLGWDLRYQPESLLHHRVGFSSGGGNSPRKLRAQRRAVARLIKRHVKPFLRPLAFTAWTFHLARLVIMAVLRGESGVIGSLLKSILPGKRNGDRN